MFESHAERLALQGGPRAIEIPGPHYVWPAPNAGLEECLRKQANRSLSDRDASGVTGEFERAFASFIGTRHALAFASGTGALHAMCAAAGLGEGDEILCCAYGFFASVSPFAYEGVRVVFCDSDERGNISSSALAAKITPHTRAVMVVHIWGNPCDMDAISEICSERGLLLLEDCSHAHFATFKGRKVGTFGCMAAFSLNQKAITTGEGGILVTNDDHLYELAVLFGHYNVRAMREIPADRSFAPFRFTGMGLKYRPHPLAMAIGVHQLERLREIERRRRDNLQLLTSAVQNHQALRAVVLPETEGYHGLYVLALQVQPGCGAARDDIYEALKAEGGSEFDVPSSTRLMDREPLFSHAHRRGEWTSPPAGQSDADAYPAATAFSGSIIKLPLWGYQGDAEIVAAYARAIEKVSAAVDSGALPAGGAGKG